MYDFSYKNINKVKKDPYFVFVKRLLPRWINGIPDSECIAIFETLDLLRKEKKSKLFLAETGCGASTIAMFLHCSLYGGKMFSWDTNANKVYIFKISFI